MLLGSQRLDLHHIDLHHSRQHTLRLASTIQPDLIKRQAHDDFSPIGWHLGHIAYIESLWIVNHLGGQSVQVPPHYDQLFAADGLPKAERENLPDLTEILAYMAMVRSRSLAILKSPQPNQSGLLPEQTELLHWLVQHESQHVEIMTMVLALHYLSPQILGRKLSEEKTSGRKLSEEKISGRKLSEEISAEISEEKRSPKTSGATTALAQRWSPLAQAKIRELENDRVHVPAGSFMQGCDQSFALDNERPAHAVWLDDYYIDRHPVTCRQYRRFMESDGYRTQKWWSEAGWQWKESQKIDRPLYWSENHWSENHRPENLLKNSLKNSLKNQPDKNQPDKNQPDNSAVCGVSWYEAEAYARFAGRRLPTESEWEKAVGAGTQATLGKVWEWTDSWFEGYAGFRPFPYVGYSQVYFDRAHRVLRGGSWATPQWALRSSFRNWYHPHRREMFVGFRCAD